MSDTFEQPGNVTEPDGDDGIIRLGSGENGNGSPENFVDPAGSGGGGNSGSAPVGNAPKRRGRKPGTKNKPRAEKAGKIDLGPFSGVLLGIHSMLANIAKVPELELDNEEAEKLANASQKVLRHYVDLEVSQKAADWTNLFMAIGGIYGPRIVATKIRKARQRQERAEASQQNRAAQEAATPKPAGHGSPNVGANVVAMPHMNMGGSDGFGIGGGPGVG